MKKIINSKPKILVVLGPTSSGKSDLAVILAKKFNGEIISADSRQVYKGMDLGTGKITKKEMRGIPHYLLDVVKPNTHFSVAKYKKLADQAVKKILENNKLPIICGGTGFYIDAVVNNILLPEVPPNMKLRKILEEKTCAELSKILQKLDPKRNKNIDQKNKVRLVRAIEIAKALGSVPKIKSSQPYNSLYIGLDLPDLILKERIATRLKKRLRAGMVAEVERLHKEGVSYRRLEKFGLEYRHCAKLLQHSSTIEQMCTNILTESFQYAKRQRTWFKRNPDIKWFNPVLKSSQTKIEKLVRKFL